MRRKRFLTIVSIATEFTQNLEQFQFTLVLTILNSKLDNIKSSFLDLLVM